MEEQIRVGAIKGEEVTRNKPAFDYIVKNKLYSKSEINKHLVKALDFPIDSIEVKGAWNPVLPGEDKDNYLSYCPDENGKSTKTCYGMKGFHLTSKVIPNWLWATFESKDNPGRDYALENLLSRSLQDNFGVDESGNFTPALIKLLTQGGLNKLPWTNYRLNGTPIDYVDQKAGEATYLGNTRMEYEFTYPQVTTMGAGWKKMRAGSKEALQQQWNKVKQWVVSCTSCHRTASAMKCNGAYHFNRAGLGRTYNHRPFGSQKIDKGYVGLDFIWAFIQAR